MLRKTLATFDELLRFLSEQSTNTSTDGENDAGDDPADIVENEGKKYFLLKENC